ncbi:MULTISPECIES: hypothetical protein [unclassified Micromonospora]|uniref:hypothetical protein n=1 Tax=unclassified Micromonospora TaxID=2617518 RepID=UPI00363E8853
MIFTAHIIAAPRSAVHPCSTSASCGGFASGATVRFTVGWTITEVDETAIAALPVDAWTDSLRQDGEATATAGVAEITGLDTRAEKWLPGLRLTMRRTKPAARHRKNLTDLERSTGWRYAIVATNITRMWGIPGSHHPQWLDVLHRSHATVDDRVRTNKAMEPAQPAVEILDRQSRVGPRREHRRRPERLDPTPQPARPTRPRTRRVHPHPETDVVLRTAL